MAALNGIHEIGHGDVLDKVSKHLPCPDKTEADQGGFKLLAYDGELTSCF
jgi:hypothetical protein